MTTSEAPKAGAATSAPGFEIRDPDASGATPTEWPSTDQIAAWANEFFRNPAPDDVSGVQGIERADPPAAPAVGSSVPPTAATPSGISPTFGWPQDLTGLTLGSLVEVGALPSQAALSAQAGSPAFALGTPPSAPSSAQLPAGGTQGFIHPEAVTSQSPGLYFLNHAGALRPEPIYPGTGAAAPGAPGLSGLNAQPGSPGLAKNSGTAPAFDAPANPNSPAFGAAAPSTPGSARTGSQPPGLEATAPGFDAPNNPSAPRLGTDTHSTPPSDAGASLAAAPYVDSAGLELPAFWIPGNDADATEQLVNPGTAPTNGPRTGSDATNGTNRARSAQPHQAFDAEAVRADFPILQERVQGRQLVWLDNAATTQKPRVVIERLAQFYEHENSNIHRAAHTLAARATDAYEAARQTVRRFLNASTQEEIVFVRGTTEGINLIAQSWGKRYVQAGDEIIVTQIEHHSNIVPWQMLCTQTGARLRVAPVDDSGQVLLEDYERLFNSRTRLVSFTHVSNALGTILPVATMTDIAHRYGARVVVDGAQSVCHTRVDVQQLDCDFFVFSGHKVFGPTGIGVVYGKRAILEAMPPYQGGGNMIGDVTFEKTVYQPPPARFEAGTGNIADAVGLGAALDYLDAIGLENVARHEHDLLVYGTAQLREIPGLCMIGTAAEKAAVMSFVLDNVPTEQVGVALASEGIAVRAGHHCAQPALRRFGLETSVRPSLAVYNNRADIDALVTTLKRLQSRWLH